MIMGVDSVANEVVYKIGTADVERVAVTVSGTGLSTVSRTIHNEATDGTYALDAFSMAEQNFWKIGALAITTASLNELYNYAKVKYSL